jgi:TPM domain
MKNRSIDAIIQEQVVRCRWLPLGLVACLGIVTPAHAVAPETKDGAKLFTPDAVKKADKEIREIARKFDKDLLIETLPGVPGAEAERVKQMSTEERGKFLRNWARDRAETAVVNGIYILILKDPPHLEIVITPKARSSFDQEAFTKLRDLLLRQLRDKHYDEALLQAVDLVRDRLAAGAK